MKLKSKCFSFILILILFTITAISASDNQTEINSDSGNYHSFQELNKTLSESGNEVNLEYNYKSDVNSSINIALNKNITIDGIITPKNLLLRGDSTSFKKG